jgi:serine/threonine-protein kinase RsbW
MVEHFKISCSKDNLKLIRKLVISFLNKQPITDVDKSLLVLAVDEMCANIIIHSTGVNNNQSISLTITFKENLISFEIQHEGGGFDLESYKEPTIDAVIKARRKGGIGIKLIKKIMDKVEYEAKEELSVYRMSKKLEIKQLSE